jgi:hypothetical protein
VQPGLVLRLSPRRDPSPLVRVELDLDTEPRDLSTWVIERGSPAQIDRASAQDARGPVTVGVTSAPGGGVALSLARPTDGHVHLEYEVRAGSDLDDPLGVLIRGDRFRAAGESLVALPAAIEDAPLPVSIDFELREFTADKAASSFGVGLHRKVTVRGRALRRALFMAGGYDEMVIDTIDGHDEASWLGVAPFDLREVVVELPRSAPCSRGCSAGGASSPTSPGCISLRSRGAGPRGRST